MISITIDDFEIFTKPNISILEACKHAGINIPRFCYHETLSVAGNCRMCLVEIENGEKPVASCVTEIEEGMIILTSTPFVKKARENVVETLLLSHPLDCPICDQAGECDLQDQTKIFGSTQSRYFFKKNTAEDKYFGPLIKTIMTRCISCTRCVRYSTEIAGEDFFGTLNRGGSTEIGSYTPKFFSSEISGNVIDLCPVGALTSQPYAFKGRPWELRVSESIDFTDSLGSNIYVSYKETEIVRILPKINKKVNENIISDKARFNYDANHINRVENLFFLTKNKQFKKSNWKNTLSNLESILNKNTSFIINHKTDIDTMYYLKYLNNLYPEKFQVYRAENNNRKTNLYLNTQINISSAIDAISDSVLFLSSNPKIENAVLNSKIRFKAKNETIDIYSFGINHDYNYAINFISFNFSNLTNNLEGKLATYNTNFYNSANPLIVIGDSFLNRVNDIHVFKNFINNIFTKNCCILLSYNLNENSLDSLNIKPLNKKMKNDTNVFSQLNETIDLKKLIHFNKANNSVWHNAHGSNLGLQATMIIPSPTIYENKQILLNLEDRPQKTEKIFYNNKEAKNLRNILRSTLKIQNYKGNFNVFNHEMSNNIQKYDSLLKNTNKKLIKQLNNSITKLYTIAKKYPFFIKNKNFYCSDTFTKNSEILTNCFNEIFKNHKNILINQPLYLFTEPAHLSRRIS